MQGSRTFMYRASSLNWNPITDSTHALMECTLTMCITLGLHAYSARHYCTVTKTTPVLQCSVPSHKISLRNKNAHFDTPPFHYMAQNVYACHVTHPTQFPHIITSLRPAGRSIYRVHQKRARATHSSASTSVYSLPVLTNGHCHCHPQVQSITYLQHDANDSLLAVNQQLTRFCFLPAGHANLTLHGTKVLSLTWRWSRRKPHSPHAMLIQVNTNHSMHSSTHIWKKTSTWNIHSSKIY
jgi:hypothetical protein